MESKIEVNWRQRWRVHSSREKAQKIGYDIGPFRLLGT